MSAGEDVNRESSTLCGDCGTVVGEHEAFCFQCGAVQPDLPTRIHPEVEYDPNDIDPFEMSKAITDPGHW